MIKHYTAYVDDIKRLKRERRYTEAIALLLKTVGMVEAESELQRCAVAPAYYLDLAIVYRKEKRYADEVAVLERYVRTLHAPNAGPGTLGERLGKARELAAKHGVSAADVGRAAAQQDNVIRPHTARALVEYVAQREAHRAKVYGGAKPAEHELPVGRACLYGCVAVAAIGVLGILGLLVFGALL